MTGPGVPGYAGGWSCSSRGEGGSEYWPCVLRTGGEWCPSTTIMAAVKSRTYLWRESAELAAAGAQAAIRLYREMTRLTARSKRAPLGGRLQRAAEHCAKMRQFPPSVPAQHEQRSWQVSFSYLRMVLVEAPSSCAFSLRLPYRDQSPTRPPALSLRTDIPCIDAPHKISCSSYHSLSEPLCRAALPREADTDDG